MNGVKKECGALHLDRTRASRMEGKLRADGCLPASYCWCMPHGCVLARHLPGPGACNLPPVAPPSSQGTVSLGSSSLTVAQAGGRPVQSIFVYRFKPGSISETEWAVNLQVAWGRSLCVCARVCVCLGGGDGSMLHGWAGVA